MAAYIILDIKVEDSLVYDAYKKLSPATVATYGGKYLVRGGKVESLEGDWRPERLVVLEFENTDKAKTWMDSPEYRPVRALRQKSAVTQSILVEGV
jgi:uncharacterized protein (DUF1330 family)